MLKTATIVDKRKMSTYEINTRRKELDAIAKDLAKQRDHLRLEYQHLQLDCEHPNKESQNTWGRDPGGAYCHDCGKHW